MDIGYLISDLEQLEAVAAWGYDYAEAVPRLLDPDLMDLEGPGEGVEEALERLCASPVPVASLCSFVPDPERNGLMVVGPKVEMERLRVYVSRVFDLMQRAGIEVIDYGSGTSRWVPDGFSRRVAFDQVTDFFAPL